MSKVWLVTGSASGLGRDIAEAVLASGDRLLATARDPGRLKDLVERYGKQVSTAPLDVTDEAAAKAAVAKAVEVFGRLDVVVNNAGYGDVAPFEQLSSERFRAVVDTNLFGVVYMTRAAIPVMRKQKSGYIFQISSVGGRLGVPGNAEASVGTFLKMLEGHWGHETSDPAKISQVILQLATEEQLPAHLLLGSDAVQYAGFAEQKRESDAKAWHDVSVSTDAEDVKGLPDFKF
jgi:enoyl-[acyl-carrier-protein] reductase (NADH)